MGPKYILSPPGERIEVWGTKPWITFIPSREKEYRWFFDHLSLTGTCPAGSRGTI